MKLKLIHGEGEIKRLDKQIKDVFKLLDGQKLNGIYINTPLIKKIRRLGFETKNSSGVAFIGKRQVIKIGYVTRFPPPLKYRIPTLTYHYEKLTRRDFQDEYVLMIQPRVTADLDEDVHCVAMSRIDRRLSGADSRNDNFGIYKNEVKLIDW